LRIFNFHHYIICVYSKQNKSLSIWKHHHNTVIKHNHKLEPASHHHNANKKNKSCLLIQLEGHDNPIQAQNELYSFEGAAHENK
jgi:hypothetical protein